MTATTRPANAAPTTETFRAVVKRVDRHQAEVLGEMRTGMATLPRGTVPIPGTVVMVRIQGGNWFIEGEALPYHEVSNVPHPTVDGLMGKPVLESSRENAFWVGGRAFYLTPEEAANDVRGWTFVDPRTEAAYVAHLIQGGAPISGVVLSQVTRQRLEEVGADPATLQQLQIGAQILETRQEALQSAALETEQRQLELSGEMVRLTGEITATKDQQTSLSADVAGLLTDRQELEQQQILLQQQFIAQQEVADALEQQVQVEEQRLQRLSSIFMRPEDAQHRRDHLDGRQAYAATTQGEALALKMALSNLKAARGTTAEQLVALHVALKHAPFTVLAGPSGSGKTSLLLAYAQQMNIHVTTVAVQPGWTSVQDLHGYVNPLQRGEYRSTPFFEALGHQVRQAEVGRLQAELQGDALADLGADPHAVPLDLVLLDEINLSHVEYFLADYLSAFEIDSRTVALTTPDEADRLAWSDGAPDNAHRLAWLRVLRGQLCVPQSFLIAGTANEDGTTRGFSDKFRDRAAFLHVEAPKLEAIKDKQSTEPARGQGYVSRATWEQWRGTPPPISQPLIDLSVRLTGAHLPISVRLFQRTAHMLSDAERLLNDLGVQDAPRKARDLAVALGVAHKYAQLTEGRDKKKERDLLLEAVQQTLGGYSVFTNAALGLATT